jgi:two-component system NarL family sensor kinase
VEQPRARVLVEPISVGSLVARFAITGLVALVFVGAFTAFASRRVGTEQAIDEAKRVAFVSSAGIVTPLLGDDLLTMDREALDRIDAAVRSSVLRGSLVRVKIWAEDGTIVYSDEPRLIGEKFEIGEDERAIFTTDEQGAEVSDLSKPENRFETDSKLLEVYLRTETPSGTPLLFEAYFRYSGVTDVGRNLWAQFAPITIGALVVLQLVQIPLAWSMARRLQTSQRERERLLRHALDASDAERRRIASDLHDGVVQELTGVSLALAAQGRSESIGRQQVLDASSAIRTSIKSLRSLLVEIYPPNLQEEGLESAIGDLISGLTARGFETRLDADLGETGIDPETAGLVYRAAQESLRNVVSHSGAKQVRVDIRTVANPNQKSSTRNHSIELVVDDDGRGFSADTLDERAADGHVGLRALAGLVADLGGTLTVRSAPGQGTRVEVSIPIDARLPR